MSKPQANGLEESCEQVAGGFVLSEKLWLQQLQLYKQTHNEQKEKQNYGYYRNPNPRRRQHSW